MKKPSEAKPPSQKPKNILSIRNSIMGSHGFRDGLNRYIASPGWIKERNIASEKYYNSDFGYEITEYLVSQSASNGILTQEFTLSVLLNSDAVEEMTMRIEGIAEPIRRHNRVGELLFRDETRASQFEGIGPYHGIMLHIQQTSLRSRMCRFAGQEMTGLDSLIRKTHQHRIVARLLVHLMNQHRFAAMKMSTVDASGTLDAIAIGLLYLANIEILGINAQSIDKIQSSLDYLHENVHRTISRDELLAVAGLGSSHFSKTFRMVIGMTVSDYLRHARICLAINFLLQDMTEAAAQIALRVGYFDRAHFAREMKHFTGLTPDAYRRSQLETETNRK